MHLHLSGVEALTIELAGALPERRARELASPLELEVLGNEGARLDLLIFRMRGLRPAGLPGPPLDYTEALWRIGVVYGGEPVWLAHTCDLDSAIVRALARRLMRYPVRAAMLVLERGMSSVRGRVDAGGHALSVRAGEVAGPWVAPARPRRVLVREGGALYEIPWREEPAPERREADVRVLLDTLSEATLGAAVAWDRRGLVHRGRVHHCDVARRLR